MKLLFIGNLENGFFVEEYAVSKKAEIKFIASNVNIKEQINQILDIKGCDYMIFDLEQYINEAYVIAEEIVRISRVNNAKPIIYAGGYQTNSSIIAALVKRDIVNFIFGVTPQVKRDQLEKCINGYYDENGMDEIKNINFVEEEEDLSELKAKHNFRTIAVTGAISRIGTTTQSIQMMKYLMLKGYRVCYIQMNTTGYVENLASFYESELDDEHGKVTFNSVEMFYKADKISDILKLGYDFYVYDYGVFEDTNFNKISFLEKDVKIIVCGTKPNEMEATMQLISNVFYVEAYYIFNFIPTADQEEILNLMKEQREQVFFSDYAPETFEFCNSPIYEKMLPVEDINPVPHKKHWWKRKR